jgi:hypothetical protein
LEWHCCEYLGHIGYGQGRLRGFHGFRHGSEEMVAIARLMSDWPGRNMASPVFLLRVGNREGEEHLSWDVLATLLLQQISLIS